jgi:hypothetical protein
LHIKVSGGIAGAAFVLSFLLGLIGRAGFPVILIRALVFAVVFFGLIEGIYVVVKRFLPELLGKEEVVEEEAESSGSNIDILVDDESDVALQQEPEIQADSFVAEEIPATHQVLVNGSDLDSMEDAFTDDNNDEPLFEPPSRGRSAANNKKFGDPEKLANAIQTLLRRDE